MKTALEKVIAALCVIGLGIAGYLTYTHYLGLAPVCLASGGCDIVQSSKYATQFGIPVPVLGLVGYAFFLGSLWIKGEMGRLIGMVAAIGGWAFSAYLTFLELFKIHAICTWCVTSFLCVTVIMILMTVRYFRGDKSPTPAEE
ncbi:MAG TPA: vitamin K epoxide reductase family protein [Puia sp.]|nr:vitamin K epoxide reductase family protein [Puia sp.]